MRHNSMVHFSKGYSICSDALIHSLQCKLINVAKICPNVVLCVAKCSTHLHYSASSSDQCEEKWK